MAIYLLLGVYAFGIVLSINIVGTLIVLALGIGTFVGFSMIGSGILILTKQGDPITALITIATSLFGNVLFPPSVLPPLLQIIAYVTPPYYFFTCIRHVLLGWTIQMILPDLLILSLNVRNHRTRRIRSLRMVPENGKEKRNPLMVLKLSCLLLRR